jgi:cytochrome c oxidase subunit 1
VAAIFGIFAATYYWFPKMFGRMMHAGMAKAHFWLTFVGAYAIFFPMHYAGLAANPRRYSQFTEVQYLSSVMSLQKFISIAAFITIGAQIIFVINLFWSMFKGEKASLNPWESTTLEWSTPSSPPPHDNFAGVVPVVNNGPYEYSVPGAAKDYIMQTDPAVATPEGH